MQDNLLAYSPVVYVTAEAIQEMTSQVLDHPTEETAWGLYGFIFPGRIALVAGVIHPIAADIQRGYATTECGGNHMADAFRWIVRNQKLTQTLQGRGIQEDAGKAAFLFKGHSHHELGLAYFSGEDVRSILKAVRVDGLEVAVGPLANIRKRNSQINRLSPFSLLNSAIRVVREAIVDYKFYYYDRYMHQQRIGAPTIVNAIVIKEQFTPPLPPLGWQFVRDADYLEQIRHLQRYGCTVKILYPNPDNRPPYEIRFVIKKSTWKGHLVITTGWDYPRKPPEFKVVPLQARTDAPQLPAHLPNAAKLKRGRIWNPGEDFIEAIFRLEARGKL